MAFRGEEKRLGGAPRPSLLPFRRSRVRRAPSLRDVRKGNDDALGLLVSRPIRQYFPNEPRAALTLDFALDRRLSLQNPSSVGKQIHGGRQRLQVREGPPHVTRNDVEQGFRRRREKADIEARVEEDRRDVGAVENVLQIVRRRALPLERLLQLAVEGV